MHHDHVNAFSFKRTVCCEDDLFSGCDSNLQREQTIWPPIIWHTINSSCSFFSFHLGTDPPRKSSTGNNLQCSQTYVNVIAPLFLTHHVSQKISTSPHDAVCKTSSLLRHPQAPPAKYSQSLSSSKPACPHSPSQHFSQVLEADPLHVTDPLTHLNYSIVCVSAQFLRIFALFFVVQTYQFLFFSYCFLRSLAKSQYLSHCCFDPTISKRLRFHIPSSSPQHLLFPQSSGRPGPSVVGPTTHAEVPGLTFVVYRTKHNWCQIQISVTPTSIGTHFPKVECGGRFQFFARSASISALVATK